MKFVRISLALLASVVGMALMASSAQAVDLDGSEMKLLIYHANQRCSASVSSRFLTTASPASQLLL